MCWVEVQGDLVSEFAGFDVDRSSARAWSRFQASLADHLVGMGDDDTLLIEVEVADDDLDGAAPYVQFAGFGEGTMLRGEVSGNAWLDEKYELGGDQCDRLAHLGWCPPTAGPAEDAGEGSANFFLDVELTEGDRLAVMTVRALREVFGVPDPAFLIAEDLVDETRTVPLPPKPSAVAADAEEPVATTAESQEHLQELVDAALTQMFGSTPEKDEDGDIPVPWGSALVFVRVEESAPVVQLFGILVEGVTDLERAAFEVNVLNRDNRFLKFFLAGDRVVAQLHLPAWPFVPEHLRTMLGGMASRLDEIDEDLVARVGGRRALEPGDDSDPTPGTPAIPGASTGSESSPEIALQTLLQLDAEGAGAVDRELVAGVCRFKRGLIVDLLRRTEEQEIAWRRAREEALRSHDTDEGAACEGEMVAWERTTNLLRGALRLVVERELGREAGRGSSYEVPQRASGRRLTPRFRGTMAPRPPRGHRIHNAEQLLQLYDVEDLVALDEKLTADAAVDVEVFDMADCVEVEMEGQSGQLPYPFTSAAFHALLEALNDRVLEEQGQE